MFTAVLFVKAVNWRQPKCRSTGEWLLVHGQVLSHETERAIDACETQMNHQRIILSKKDISKSYKIL